MTTEGKSVRVSSSGITRGPKLKPFRLTPKLDTSTIYTPEESLGGLPPAGGPAVLTSGLTPNPNLR